MSSYTIDKITRRLPWNNTRNRRGGKSIIWLVKDSAGCIVLETFTKREALAWIATREES